MEGSANFCAASHLSRCLRCVDAMRVVFRVDADGRIGTGHAMRCLALAAALKARGAECVFLMREDGIGSIAGRIVEEGHRFTGLAAPENPCSNDDLAHSHFLPGGQAPDAEACGRALDGALADLLIIDHYGIDRRWQRAMRGHARRILVIDDLADRPHDCDLLLDQNLVADFESRYDTLVPAACQRLLGPRYALLRSEFERRPQTPQTRDELHPRLLVMFGGADPQNLTLKAVDLLVQIGWQGGVDVVAGPLHADPAGLRHAMATLPDAVLHAPARNVSALMAQADLSIGSPGVASWERCALALPSITISQAFNQEAIGAALGEAGAALHLGRAEDVPDALIKAALLTLGSNPLARGRMSRIAAEICDACGMSRVISRLLPPDVAIRKARSEDAAMLFSWRNDPRTRRFSHDDRELVLDEHLKWMERALARTNLDLLVASVDTVPVACLRFDRHGERALVSIYLDPEMQGGGLGLSCLNAALGWLSRNHPAIRFTDADVRAGNGASHGLFTAAGYRLAYARYERMQD